MKSRQQMLVGRRREVLPVLAILFFVLATLARPLHAEWQFGEPIMTANINEPFPVWEGEPNLSFDGLSMYFHSGMRPGPEFPVGDFYLYVATRESVEDGWRTPEPLPVELNQGGDGGPSISSDGLSLYFSRGDEMGPGLEADIYYTTRETTNSPWMNPQPVTAVNATGVADLYPDISSNELELYFSSVRAGGEGGSDIWVSRRSSTTEPWGEPESLAINTINYETAPDLSEDGLTLLFGTSPPDGVEARSTDYDLWVTHRDTLTSPWQDPTPLPDTINEFGAIFPHLSPDGSTLYFGRSLIDTSDLYLASQHADIWQAPVIPEPSSAVLLMIAVAGFACMRRSKRSRFRTGVR